MSAPATNPDPFGFDNSYARMPDRFFARQAPTPVAAPRLIRINKPLARELNLDPALLASCEGVAVLAGNKVPAAGDPIAMAYAGHQFGNFVPQLGDGRAILLGEVIDRAGRRYDIQLKGAGPTPFSRRGDGRAALGPVLREYIVSEAMAALGIPTTRALAAVATGETVRRESALPGAVLTRVASSHIRVGTFQFFAARGDVEGVRALADHVIARHYPDASEAPNQYLAMFKLVMARQASLVASWLHVGFIHGVMNTDNMSVAGETIDYGPCAFMDHYDAATVFSSIDQMGRYAYGNQPGIAQWNLARLAETLLPLFSDDQETAIAVAQEALGGFVDLFTEAHEAGLTRKLGLAAPRAGDAELANDLLTLMATDSVDFTNGFRCLSDAVAGGYGAAALRTLFADLVALDAWQTRWRERLAAEARDPDAVAAQMQRTNPAFIPRNHLVEEVIEAAIGRDDFGPFETMLCVTARPFEDQPEFARYALPPRPEEVVQATFCGT